MVVADRDWGPRGGGPGDRRVRHPADVGRRPDVSALVAGSRGGTVRSVLLQRRGRAVLPAGRRRPMTSSSPPGRSMSWLTCGRRARYCRRWWSGVTATCVHGLGRRPADPGLALAVRVTKHAAVAVAEWLSINYADAASGSRACVLRPCARRCWSSRSRPDRCGAAARGGTARSRGRGRGRRRGARRRTLPDLPHEVVAQHLALKGSQPERWLKGMRKIVRQARAETAAE